MKLIMFFLIFLCIQCTPEQAHVRAAHKVMNSFTKKMKNEGFELSSSGGAMMGNIQEITLRYICYQSYSIEQARILLVEKCEDLIRQINANEGIRPFLHDFPVSSKNINISFSFRNEEDDYPEFPCIAFVFLNSKKNCIYYEVGDNDTNRLERIHSEPYEEALRIYNEAVSGCCN